MLNLQKNSCKFTKNINELYNIFYGYYMFSRHCRLKKIKIKKGAEEGNNLRENPEFQTLKECTNFCLSAAKILI